MKIVCIDNGLYCAPCEDLSDGGKNEVYFYTPWAQPFPSVNDYQKGYGYGNLKKELWPFYRIPDADMVVNFDVSNNDLIDFLRKQFPSKSIFGAGRGEKLEHDRVFLKEWLKTKGMPVGPYEVIKGFSNLVKYLKTSKGTKWIKTNIFRGDMETFRYNTWDDDKYYLDEIAVILGLLKENYTFVIEEDIEAVVQSGSDNFFTGGNFVPFSWGFEIDKNLCVNKVINDIDEMPQELLGNLEALRPLMERMDYRGPVSTEERITVDHDSYLMDFTARLPAPMGQMYSVFIKNWAEVVYKIGKNEMPEIDCDHDYIGSYALMSEHARNNNVKVMVDPKHLKDVRFQMVAQNSDGYFALKGNEGICVLIAGGKNPQEVLDKLKEAKKYVDAMSLDDTGLHAIDHHFEEAHEAVKSLGIKF